MNAKYNTIGVEYNLTRTADPFLMNKLFEHLTPSVNGLYLDIGCGTGNYTCEFEKRGFKFIGIDPSERMLAKAKLKNDKVDWRLGSAEETNLADNSVDGIIGTLTTHHWASLKKGFKEMSRVLRTNGKIIIFTATPNQMSGYWLQEYFPNMLSESERQMPTLEDTLTSMELAGIELVETEKYFIRPELEDKFLYCGKHNPELYFDEQIRNGISSFTSLSNKVEVEMGLKHLRKDIDTDNIKEVIKKYENDRGDYLYVIGRKK